MTVKIAFTTEAVTWRPRSFGGSSDREALDRSDDADGYRHEGGFDQSGKEGIEADRRLQLGQKGTRTDALIEPSNKPTSEQRLHVADEYEHRQADRKSHEARQDKNIDGIEPHDGQGVDLLAHLHGAELGGETRAGTPGDHDRGE